MRTSLGRASALGFGYYPAAAHAQSGVKQSVSARQSSLEMDRAMQREAATVLRHLTLLTVTRRESGREDAAF